MKRQWGSAWDWPQQPSSKVSVPSSHRAPSQPRLTVIQRFPHARLYKNLISIHHWTPTTLYFGTLGSCCQIVSFSSALSPPTPAMKNIFNWELSHKILHLWFPLTQYKAGWPSAPAPPLPTAGRSSQSVGPDAPPPAVLTTAHRRHLTVCMSLSEHRGYLGTWPFRPEALCGKEEVTAELRRRAHAASLSPCSTTCKFPFC